MDTHIEKYIEEKIGDLLNRIHELENENERLLRKSEAYSTEVERLTDALRDIAAAPRIHGEKRAREAVLESKV